MTDPTDTRRSPIPRVDAQTGQTILKADSSEAFLRMVPLLIGHEPHDSVVLVLFKERRTHGAIRIDLPTSDRPLHLKRWATTVIGIACKVSGVTGVVPVVYTSDRFAPTGRLPRAAVLRALNRCGQNAGLRVKDLYCVAADGWGSPDDADLPRGGHDLDEIEALPPDSFGPETRPDRDPRYPEPVEAGTLTFWNAVERWWTSVGGPLGADRRPLHGVDLRRPGSAIDRHDRHAGSAFHRMRFGLETPAAIDLIEAALAPHDEDPERPCSCRALLYCFSRRDGLSGLVLVQIGWGKAAARRCWDMVNAAVRPSGDELGKYLGGTVTERPDPDRVEEAIRLLLDIGAHVPPPSRAGVDAMLAWLYWSLGASSTAARLAERALGVDDEQALAVAVRRLSANLPEWAFGEPDLAVPA